MLFSTTAVLKAMLAMAPMTAHAHVVMTSPVPFGHPDTSPLLADGSNFPCKGIPATGGTVNEWPIGSIQYLKLNGTAVHNGGSCQMSVTMDKAPTTESTWKVIHSWVGGCPDSPPTGGNYLESEHQSRTPLPFLIPSELPSGDYVAAFTWSNHLGNREFYQDCAPVRVSGAGAKDHTAYDKLPDMAVANIASVNSCQNEPGYDYIYENPGQYVTPGASHVEGGGLASFMKLCGGPVVAKNPFTESTGVGTGGPGSADPHASPSASPASPGNPSPAPSNAGTSSQVLTSTAAPAPSSSAQASTLRTIIITVTAPSGLPPAGATPAPAPISQSLASAPQSSATATPGAPLPSGQACSPDGAVICSSDGMHFALCNHGKAIFQAVALGTTCSGGKVAKRQDMSTLRTVYT
ncbi:hypothetical protein ACEQ8H_001790 [Pleosporales sp. CAS-2024a]